MTVKTAELASELRKISGYSSDINDTKSSFSKQEMDRLLLETRTRVIDPNSDLPMVIYYLGGEILSSKIKALNPDSDLSTLKDGSGMYPPNNPAINAIIGALYDKIKEHSDDVGNRGTFASMARPNKSAAEKLTNALDTVLQERGIKTPEQGQSLGR